MPNQKNQELVTGLREKVKKAKAMVFAEYKGLDANSMNALKGKVREENAEIAIAKNTLLKKALEEENVDTKDLQLDGQLATVFAYEDAISPLKKLTEFAKEFSLPEIKFGLIEGIFNDKGQLEILSKLPGKDQLIAQVVGGLKSPINGIVNVLGGPQRKLVYALSAIAEKRSEEVSTE
jgi:large subunit ribosomal protein L10